MSEDAEESARRLAELHGLRFVDLTQSALVPGAASLLPEDVARRHHAVPIGRRLGTPVIAVADPGDLFAMDALRASVGREYVAVVARPDQVDRAIGRSTRRPSRRRGGRGRRLGTVRDRVGPVAGRRARCRAGAAAPSPGTGSTSGLPATGDRHGTATAATADGTTEGNGSQLGHRHPGGVASATCWPRRRPGAVRAPCPRPRPRRACPRPRRRWHGDHAARRSRGASRWRTPRRSDAEPRGRRPAGTPAPRTPTPPRPGHRPRAAVVGTAAGGGRRRPACRPATGCPRAPRSCPRSRRSRWPARRSPGSWSSPGGSRPSRWPSPCRPTSRPASRWPATSSTSGLATEDDLVWAMAQEVGPRVRRPEHRHRRPRGGHA